MKPKHHNPTLPLILVGLTASVALVRTVQGGGPDGGEVIPGPPPLALTDPGGRGQGGDSAGLIRVLSAQPYTIESSSMTASALVAGSHTGSDLATTGSAGQDDSLEVRLKDDSLAVWAGLSQVRLHGRFSVTDWNQNDGEKLSLAADIGGRGLLLLWVGQRQSNEGGVVGSFGTLQSVQVIPLPKASVDLKDLRTALQPFAGQGLDVGVAVIARRKGPAGRNVAYAAFAIDDQLSNYDVETP